MATLNLSQTFKPRQAEPGQEKLCRVCREYKPLSEYSTKQGGLYGVDSICIPCKRIASRERARMDQEERIECRPLKYVPTRWQILGFALPRCTDDCLFWTHCCNIVNSKSIDDPACFVDSPRFAEFKQQYGKSAKKGKA